MKKVYERPMMVCDQFTADEFVATCIEVTKATTFTCDTKAWFNLFVFDNGNGKWDLNGADVRYNDGIINNYSPCDKTTCVEDLKPGDVIKIGWIYDAGDGQFNILPDKVYAWTEGGTNLHVTRELGSKDNYEETNKS